jgi:hypothetical protein
LDDIVLPQGATGGKDDGGRGGSAGGGGGRRGSKSAAAAAAAAADASGLGAYGGGLEADYLHQATLAALMQQGAWQVGFRVALGSLGPTVMCRGRVVATSGAAVGGGHSCARSTAR